MRKLGSLLASALLIVAVGCSDDNNTKKDAGNTPGVDGGTTPGVDSGTTPGIDAPVSPADVAAGDTPIDGANPGIDGGKGIDGGTNPGIDSGKGVDGGTNPGIDGGKGIDGGTNPGIDGGAGACEMPSCMTNVSQNCVPSGTCTTQSTTDMTTMSQVTSNCYANGVKMVQAVSQTAMTVTFKNQGAVCYSMVVDMATPTVMPVKDASGKTIATLSFDMATSKVTITCTGGQPVVLDSSCTSAMGIGSGATSSSCTQGTCAP